MNRLARQAFVTPSCHLGEKIPLAGWAMAVGAGLALWTVIFSLL
ncbi:MAG: hypothetical protein P8Y58_12450 [Novosphingobium sp.]